MSRPVSHLLFDSLTRTIVTVYYIFRGHLWAVFFCAIRIYLVCTRVQATSEMHNQFTEFHVFVSISRSRIHDIRDDRVRKDDMVICKFGLKSKDDAIIMCEKIIIEKMTMYKYVTIQK